ncbi:MAG TPA: metalloregulator ArsR/SmtB family transcription factor [Elusimicrobiota bacterium]|jgi:ArsR family transcriptional regulator|nr:metalloregulator ArsR/SmtB family transcription factor [Elusimicrobiota bacterium]
MFSPDRTFRAFADETRLRILHLLSKRELCVCDLIAVLGAPQPKISRHLSYLKRAGLVQDRQEGRWRHYSLAKPKSPFQKRLIDCVACCLDEAPVLRRDAAKLKEAGIRCL